jgi:hypothetical protein
VMRWRPERGRGASTLSTPPLWGRGGLSHYSLSVQTPTHTPLYLSLSLSHTEPEHNIRPRPVRRQLRVWGVRWRITVGYLYTRPTSAPEPTISTPTPTNPLIESADSCNDKRA